MEVYGETGYIITKDNTNMQLRNKEHDPAQAMQVTTADIPVYQDPIAYFADVIRGKITVPKNGLYSLENNVTVVHILDAARQSSKTGKTVYLNDKAATTAKQ
jgi:predicted dehydrogenase